jgi:hypothetical protein
MKGYIGEFDVDITKTSFFKDYTALDWVEYWIASYGQIDGSHHKDWVMDQVMRIIKGTPVIIKEARWDGEDGKFEEYRISLDTPSKEYENFVEEYEQDGEYSWDTGIAP